MNMTLTNKIHSIVNSFLSNSLAEFHIDPIIIVQNRTKKVPGLNQEEKIEMHRTLNRNNDHIRRQTCDCNTNVIISQIITLITTDPSTRFALELSGQSKKGYDKKISWKYVEEELGWWKTLVAFAQ